MTTVQDVARKILEYIRSKWSPGDTILLVHLSNYGRLHLTDGEKEISSRAMQLLIDNGNLSPIDSQNGQAYILNK